MLYRESLATPVLDKTAGAMVVPMTCPCCVKCWLIVKDLERKGREGRCVHGGPYKGYVEVLDTKV